MQRNFVDLAKFLEQNFPELRGHVTGAFYPPPPIAVFLSNVISFLQMIAIGWMIIGGEKLLRLVGYKNQLPNFYHTIQQNPMPILMGLFLLAPSMISKYQNNGAFEIYLDEEIIFSKLQAGRFPTANILIEAFSNAGLKQSK
jgi:thioredoxin reductase-like selenoprotein T